MTRRRRAIEPSSSIAAGNGHAPRGGLLGLTVDRISLDFGGIRVDLLREVMSETGTTQTMLSRVSGVHQQPSVSQFLSGEVDLSDDQLDRLLSCWATASRSYADPSNPTSPTPSADPGCSTAVSRAT